MFHIIDDEKVLAEMIAEILESIGFQVMAFSNPLTYLDYVNSASFTEPLAIFTDMKMPQMGGYRLIHEVRKRFPKQKFVVISGERGSEKPIGKAACHFITKPFQPQFLIDTARAIQQCSMYHPTTEFLDDPVTETGADSWQCPLDCRECGNGAE